MTMRDVGVNTRNMVVVQMVSLRLVDLNLKVVLVKLSSLVVVQMVLLLPRVPINKVKL